MERNRNSEAYQGIVDADDHVHDYERKAPLDIWSARQMFRVQPHRLVTSKEYLPDDVFDLIKTLQENKSSIIPTCDLPETYYHIMHNVDGSGLKIKVSPSEDEGWSRVEVDLKEGKLARELFKQDFPDLFKSG